MNYQEALDYLSILGPTLERPSLTRMEKFFEEKGCPQDSLSSIHVGGTNGKGSVTTFITSIFRELDYPAAKFTGPHLVRFNERFEIDGKTISDQDFAEAATIVRIESENFAQRHNKLGALTWFEFLMAMSVYLFSKYEVKPAVFEVGLGGRFDATNVLNSPAVSVVTNVDLDHVHLLGDTREKIAFEKAGIIKKQTPVVTLATGGALSVIRERALSLLAPLVVLGQCHAGTENLFRSFSIEIVGDYNMNESEREWLFHLPEYLREREDEVELGLPGAYQRLNALAALFASALYLGRLNLPPLEKTIEWMLAGLTKAKWPGRFQIHSQLPVILDGAHNPHGAGALKSSLDEMYPGKRRIFIFGCFENKNVESMLESLLTAGDVVLCPEISNVRATRSTGQIIAIAKSIGASAFAYNDFAGAMQAGLSMLSSDNTFADRLIVTGSFALVRELIQMN